MSDYATPIVRVTWTLDAVTDGGTRTDLVDLTRGREKGREDDDTIRTILAVKWMGEAGYGRHVRILSVEAAEYPLPVFSGSFAEGTYNGPVSA